jgi:hypothetical protein
MSGLRPAISWKLADRSPDLGAPGPLRDGADVSWLPSCLPGDDQGSSGACALFALASWAEIMHRTDIHDHAVLKLYAQTVKALGRTQRSGLTYPEAYRAARAAGWLPSAQGIEQLITMDALYEQPLLAGYIVTPAWDRQRVSKQGNLDHTAPRRQTGRHAVVIVAYGSVAAFGPEKWVYIENSWGGRWGWRGIGVMTEDLHRQMIRELWRIRL